MANNQINLIKREDWINRQICGDFPDVDARCLIFCCSGAKPCPYRNAVLAKMGLSVEDYAKIKETFAEKMFEKPPLAPPSKEGDTKIFDF